MPLAFKDPATDQVLKTCTRCKVTKPITEFRRESRPADGRCFWCKACKNERARAAWPQESERRKLVGSMTVDEWRKASKGKSKYGNQKITIEGRKFDSLKEAGRWGELQILCRMKQIGSLECQVRYPIQIVGKDGKLKRVCTYVADFVYIDLITGKVVVEDVKGVRTPVYKLKKILMKTVLGIEIVEI